MSEMQKLLEDIKELKRNLNALIEEKGFNLQDPEIIAASQIVNAAITKYNDFIKKQI